ncbi:MAG: hypothetical protein ACOC8D_00180 [bacterium]
MPSPRLAVLAAACLVAAGAGGRAGQPAQRATVTTPGMSRRPISEGDRAGQQRAEQPFDFHLGPARYRIRYLAFLDPQRPDRAFPSEGYLGMPRPSSCNWYHGGFLFVRVNGQDIGRARRARACVAETGQRAIADLVWDAAPAVVRVRFVGLAGDDKLLCEIALEPKAEVDDLRLRLRCYPSFFTAWHDRDGHRRVATPAATLDQGKRVELPAADHRWAVYYDTVFDPARGEGDGPCAALWLPDAVRAVRFRVGSYPVDTELLCRPGARSIRLAFWDLRGQANAAVLQRVRREAERWANQLREVDLTPAAVRAFEPEAELARLDRLTRSAEVRKQLGERAEAYRRRIRALGEVEGVPGILAQADLLDLLADYREFLWELRLAALLAD